ncbi:hypothetical protein, partial [Roseobacter sp.]|uniref:hypothetical protein n=1 Tax=Roseobacter sp. TaxID=1907202 RepID=UPI003296F88F
TGQQTILGLWLVLSISAQRAGLWLDTLTRQCMFTCMRGHKRVYRIYCTPILSGTVELFAVNG